jgi:hypothetical protein
VSFEGVVHVNAKQSWKEGDVFYMSDWKHFYKNVLNFKKYNYKAIYVYFTLSSPEKPTDLWINFI